MTEPLHTTILFNPISTGDSRKNAEELHETLASAGFDVEIMKTEYPAHAIEIARDVANANKHAFIVSSSGDGGYHEIINGILSSDHPSAIAGLLPSGNANDHYNFVHRGDIVERVRSLDTDTIDVLKVVTPQWTRYAHSYVGLGVTPQIGEVLTKHKLNPIKESWIVATHLFKIHPVKVRVSGKVRRYDHMVFSTIGKMSKYLTLDENASVTDGLFEVTVKRHGTFLELLRHFMRAVAAKSGEVEKDTQRELTILRSTTIQLDGEVLDVSIGDDIVITCEKQALHCIV